MALAVLTVVPPVKSVSATNGASAGPPELIRIPPAPEMGVEVGVGVKVGVGVGVPLEERRPKIVRFALRPTNASPFVTTTVLYFTYPFRPSRLGFWLLS